MSHEKRLLYAASPSGTNTNNVHAASEGPSISHGCAFDRGLIRARRYHQAKDATGAANLASCRTVVVVVLLGARAQTKPPMTLVTAPPTTAMADAEVPTKASASKVVHG